MLKHIWVSTQTFHPPLCHCPEFRTRTLLSKTRRSQLFLWAQHVCSHWLNGSWWLWVHGGNSTTPGFTLSFTRVTQNASSTLESAFKFVPKPPDQVHHSCGIGVTSACCDEQWLFSRGPGGQCMEEGPIDSLCALIWSRRQHDPHKTLF